MKVYIHPGVLVAPTVGEALRFLDAHAAVLGATIAADVWVDEEVVR